MFYKRQICCSCVLQCPTSPRHGTWQRPTPPPSTRPAQGRTSTSPLGYRSASGGSTSHSRVGCWCAGVVAVIIAVVMLLVLLFIVVSVVFAGVVEVVVAVDFDVLLLFC